MKAFFFFLAIFLPTCVAGDAWRARRCLRARMAASSMWRDTYSCAYAALQTLIPSECLQACASTDVWGVFYVHPKPLLPRFLPPHPPLSLSLSWLMCVPACVKRFLRTHPSLPPLPPPPPQAGVSPPSNGSCSLFTLQTLLSASICPPACHKGARAVYHTAE